MLFHLRATCDTYTNISDYICNVTNKERLYVYTGIVGAVIPISFLTAFFLYLLTILSSRVLHNNMLGALLRTHTYFFDANPSGEIAKTILTSHIPSMNFHAGRILNRFSKDVGNLDDVIPVELGESLQVC